MKEVCTLMLAILLSAGVGRVNAQCSESCGKCKKQKTFACKLTSPELQQRKAEVITVLKEKVLERKELNKGVRFIFQGTKENFDMLTDFIKSEHECCGFFDFKLSYYSNDIIWLDITGPKGAKEFIAAELEM